MAKSRQFYYNKKWNQLRRAKLFSKFRFFTPRRKWNIKTFWWRRTRGLKD